VWFEPGGSPPLAQFFENRRCWTKAAGFCGRPGQGESLVQRPALGVRQIIAFVVGHEIDGRPFGQGGRLIEDQSSQIQTRFHSASGIKKRKGMP
jgi:hypothetical protein